MFENEEINISKVILQLYWTIIIISSSSSIVIIVVVFR